MIETKIFFIPLIGAVIGLFTNWIAVKMLFHPKKRVFGIQGVIPKRKEALADKIGDMSLAVLPEAFDKLKEISFIGPKVHARLSEYFKNGVQNKVNKMDNDELERIILKTINNELNFIVWIGAVVGFFVGCIQALIIII